MILIIRRYSVGVTIQSETFESGTQLFTVEEVGIQSRNKLVSTISTLDDCCNLSVPCYPRRILGVIVLNFKLQHRFYFQPFVFKKYIMLFIKCSILSIISCIFLTYCVIRTLRECGVSNNGCVIRCDSWYFSQKEELF